jgi:hypothetical protein
VVIASAYRTVDPGFESHQGVRFFWEFMHSTAVVITYYASSLCVLEKSKNAKKIFKKIHNYKHTSGFMQAAISMRHGLM